jgi:hypothetical protein
VEPESGLQPFRRRLGLAGIWSYQSGSPFSILSGYGTLNSAAGSALTNTASVTGTTMSQLDKVTSGVFKTGDNVYFVSPAILNTDGRGTSQPGASGFAGQLFYNPEPGTLGNRQRRAFSGPWNFAWDMSAIKTLRSGEKQRLDLHFDVFNVLRGSGCRGEPRRPTASIVRCSGRLPAFSAVRGRSRLARIIGSEEK